MLEVQGLTKHFSGLTAIANVDLALAPESIVGLIGPNGAGKSTLFGLISAVMKPTRGQLTFNGVALNGLKPHQVCRPGHCPHVSGAAHLSWHDCPGVRQCGCHVWQSPAGDAGRGAAAGQRASRLYGAGGDCRRRAAASCRQHSAGGWRSLQRWRPDHNCCSWTSPSPG